MSWEGGSGIGDGIDADGGLHVRRADGAVGSCRRERSTWPLSGTSVVSTSHSDIEVTFVG